MDKPIIVIVFLIICIGLIIYLISNAPNIFKAFPREGSSFWSLAPSYKNVPSYSSQSGIQTYGGSNIVSQSSSSYLSSIPDYQIPKDFTRADLSPYFNKIRISSVHSSAFSNPAMQMQLYAYLSQGENADISGWRIKSNHGEITITQAVNVYEPSGTAPREDIILSGNNYVNIYTNKGSILRNLRNLRLNKCIGYLESQEDFNPDLPKNCPYIPTSDIGYLSGQCQGYILSLGACQMPDVGFYNLLPGNDEGNDCRYFLNTINYGSCFKNHRSDADFLSNEWRVWIDWADQNILDPSHDIVRLFDRQGLLVSEYRY